MDSVSVFLEIVKNGSISRTADLLGYSQSNLSHMLSVLEKELDTTLLIRSRSGVRLTAEGEMLLPYLNDIAHANERLDEKVQAMHGLTMGKVRVAAFASVSYHWLPEIIQGFHEKYPQIEFDLLHGSYTEIESWISSGSVDCAFIRLPTNLPMKTWPLKEDPFFAILPPDHRYRDYDMLSLDSLCTEPFILPDDIGDNEILPFFRSRGCTPNVRYTVPDIFTVMAMVRVGLGVSILSALAVEGLDDSLLVKKLNEKESRKIGLAAAAKPSSAAKKFIQFVLQWVAEKYS